ncbi:MAG: response regulator [Desulfurobacteriaceae bacterium]
MKVLIVDDEKTIRGTLKEILEEEGFEVFVEDTGSKVLRALENIQPEILILDLFLPGISGMDVLESLYDKGFTKNTAVIIVSGHGTVETSVKAMKLGAFDFIEKPIKYEKLLKTIESAKDFVIQSRTKDFDASYTELPLRKAKETFEKRYIEEVLKKFNWDLKKAAAFMEIDISNLYRKLNKYGINNQ